MFTLRQLAVFQTLVHAGSVTRAAKQLGVSQPALSQQLAKLEKSLGVRLFERAGNELRLTEAGRILARKAAEILAAGDELQAAMRAFAEGRRARVALGALASAARMLVPGALDLARREIPGLEVDVHELAPGEMVDQLYARNLHIAILAESTVARHHLSFARRPLCTDGYVLAVPPELELDGVRHPERDLPAAGLALLRRVIEFNFGTPHRQRMQEWYRRHVGRVETVARVRQYETALALVEAGHGTALVPLGAAVHGERPLFRVRLYAVPGMERRLVALFPSQYGHLRPWSVLLDALGEAGRSLRLLAAHPPPPFVRRPCWPEERGERPATAATAYGTEKSMD